NELSQSPGNGVSVADGQPVRAVQTFRIAVSDESLRFQEIRLTDPVPLGRQILEAAAVRPIEEFSLFALLANGDFEDVRLDEPFDLRAPGVERFVYFRTDRTFKFTIDNRQLNWGKPIISGKLVRTLADVQPGYAVYQEVRGGQDREIADTDLIDLSKPGIERFITVIKETTEGKVSLPSIDRAYLEQHEMVHEVVKDGDQLGVILKGVKLPEGKFDAESADLLILLPAGYPDACPDMFYLLPWVRLKATAAFPSKADAAHTFNGQSWQRWSRHSSEWRAGVDGLHTMIARALHAMEATK
ncbi:MAG: hypothetical protein JWM11_2085, partial [Planctomycetaceae bacterium]|nr:hypothetical protein [Planctomycetaceae bacterium]